MFRNMASSLFEHEIIKTTLVKAKELRTVAEPLITLAKKDSVANRRLAFDRTRNKEMVGKKEFIVLHWVIIQNSRSAFTPVKTRIDEYGLESAPFLFDITCRGTHYEYNPRYIDHQSTL